jgi:rubrerythrin
MTVEEAIRTALTYETRVREVYAQARTATRDEAGARFLEVLADEEQRHVGYLESRLAEWTATGRISTGALATALPAAGAIREAVKSLRNRLALPAGDRDEAVGILKRALAVETETSAYYRGLVGSLPDGDARRMFARFLEIEDGHVAIVAAELDSVRGLGFFFDVREFDLEAG